MVYIFTFVALLALSVGLGFIFGDRSDWSRRRVALVAALPIPIIIWGLGGLILAIVSVDQADMCDSDGCSGPMIAVAVMVAIGVVAYALGIVFALVGLQLARPKSGKTLDDIFK